MLFRRSVTTIYPSVPKYIYSFPFNIKMKTVLACRDLTRYLSRRRCIKASERARGLLATRATGDGVVQHLFLSEAPPVRSSIYPVSEQILRRTIVNRTYSTYTKTYIFRYFYQQYLVLFTTMVPRK